MAADGHFVARTPAALPIPAEKVNVKETCLSYLTMMTRLFVLSRLPYECREFIRKCESCIEEQLLARQSFEKSYVESFDRVSGTMQDSIHAILGQYFKGKELRAAYDVLKKNRW